MNILLCVPMLDRQSGVYLHDTFVKMGHRVAYFDWKQVTKDKGIEGMNKELIHVISYLKPDMTLIAKGLNITANTVKEMKKVHNHSIVGWIFDVTLGGTYVKDVAQYVDFIKELDIFYTMDADAVEELKSLGVNAKYLAQAACDGFHSEQVINAFQKGKYGADVVFMGTLGSIHPNREKFLKRICDEGFNFKIYGEVYYPEGKEPEWIKDHHTGYSVTNEMHSTVCNSSKIVIGLDGWPHRSKSYSIRIYKTMCAGAFYLGIDTKDMEQVFKKGIHLDTFVNENEMVEKIIKYLSDDKLREKIAREGQKEVLDKHMFPSRLKKILEDVNQLSKT